MQDAESARQGIKGPTQGYWMSHLDRERDNLLSAHAWCEDAPDGARMGLNLARGTKLESQFVLTGMAHRAAPGFAGRFVNVHIGSHRDRLSEA